MKIFRISLTKIYALLIDKEVGEKNCQLLWEYDIQNQIDEKEWNRTNAYILDISANIAIRESFYKVKYRWYLTSRRIHRIFPDSDSKCWRCKSDIGNMIHIWWSCPLLKQYWQKIHYKISHVLKMALWFTPQCCLLHLHLSLNKADTVLLNNLLAAEKMLIARNWKMDEIPTSIVN